MYYYFTLKRRHYLKKSKVDIELYVIKNIRAIDTYK